MTDFNDEVIAWLNRKIERRQKHIADLKKTIKGLYPGNIEHLAETSHYGGILKDNEEILASLLANRAGLERQRKNNTSLEHSTMSELKYEDGYNACLAELQTEIYDLIRSVMN